VPIPLVPLVVLLLSENRVRHNKNEISNLVVDGKIICLIINIIVLTVDGKIICFIINSIVLPTDGKIICFIINSIVLTVE
jgi:hypothetical protein